MEFDNYSSHLNIFEKLFETYPVKSAIEFGLGKYSSLYLAKHCDIAVSVEQESMEWYEKVSSEISSPNWKSMFEKNPNVVFKYFDDQKLKFDLVFSDGLAETRCLVANLAMARNVPFVVIHDAEKIWYYGWNLLNIPNNYKRYNFRHSKGANKVTTILTCVLNDSLDDWIISDHERILFAYSTSSQPVINITYPGDKKYKGQ